MTETSHKKAVSDDGFTYAFYFVAFIDILGQRQLLRGLTDIPTTTQGRERTIGLLRKTVGSVLTLRRAFSDFFEAYWSQGTVLDHIHPTLRAALGIDVPVVPQQVSFSDSVIIAVPLHTDQHYLRPVIAVHAAMMSLCALVPYLLARKIPVRGGMDVSPLLELAAGDLYGPALERAYVLESERAGYPRICAGEGLLAYLKAISEERGASPPTRVAVTVARESSRLLVEDTDGMPIIDHCGEAAYELSHRSGTVDVVADAYGFVVEQLQEHKRRQDEKLVSRYQRLCEYMEVRLDRWCPRIAPAFGPKHRATGT